MKLQSAVDEMSLQLQETKELLKKEREAARKGLESGSVIQEAQVIDQGPLTKECVTKTKVVEQGSAIQEVKVIDQVQVNKLTAETEQLKVRMWDLSVLHNGYWILYLKFKKYMK